MKRAFEGSDKPLLYGALSVLLPTEEQTWLLRACLHKDEAVAQAWQTWQNRVGDAKKALAAETRLHWLLPLLYQALRSIDVAVDRGLEPYLRTAYFREELRTTAYRRTCAELLAPLAAANIPLILFNDAALAGTVYPNWTLRHGHAVDVLVREEDVLRAVRALSASDLSLASSGPHPTATFTRFEHQSRVHITLHRDLFSHPYYRAPLAEMWARSIPNRIVGVPLRTLAPEDTLLQVCGQAACTGERESLFWVCDAWYVIIRSQDMDWHLLTESAARCHLALPLAVMLGYLAEQLQAPIPGHVSQNLEAAAAQSTPVEREAALWGVRAGSHATLSSILRGTRSWSGRATVLRWMLLPSPTCLRWSYGIPSSWLLPVYYLWRPIGLAARRLSRDRVYCL